MYVTTSRNAQEWQEKPDKVPIGVHLAFLSHMVHGNITAHRVGSWILYEVTV